MPRASSRHPPGPDRGAIAKRPVDAAAKTKRRRTGDPSSTQEGGGAASSFATTPPVSDNEERMGVISPSQHTQTQTQNPARLMSPSQAQAKIISPNNSQGSNTSNGERSSYDWATSLNMKVWKGWHQVHVVPYRKMREDGRGVDDVYPPAEGYPNTVGKFWSMKNTPEGRKTILSLLGFYSYSGWRTWHEPEYPEEIGSVRTRPYPSLEAAAQTFPERAHEALGMVLHLDFTRISEASAARRISRGNLIKASTTSPMERKRTHEEMHINPFPAPAPVVVTEGGKTRVMSNMSMLNLQLENWEWQERRHKEKRTKALSKLKDNLKTAYSPPSRPLRDNKEARKSPIDGGPPSSQRHMIPPNETISTATTMLQKDLDAEKSIMETSQREEEDGDDDESGDDNEGIGGTQILTDELPSQKNGLLPPSSSNPHAMMDIEGGGGIQQRAQLGSPFAANEEFGGNGFGGISHLPGGPGPDPMNISQRYNRYRAKDPEEEVYESESTDADEEIICPKT